MGLQVPRQPLPPCRCWRGRWGLRLPLSLSLSGKDTHYQSLPHSQIYETLIQSWMRFSHPRRPFKTKTKTNMIARSTRTCLSVSVQPSLSLSMLCSCEWLEAVTMPDHRRGLLDPRRWLGTTTIAALAAPITQCPPPLTLFWLYLVSFLFLFSVFAFYFFIPHQQLSKTITLMSRKYGCYLSISVQVYIMKERAWTKKIQSSMTWLHQSMWKP